MKISYKFCDGTSCEVEVDEELYAQYKVLVDEEKRNHWRETRRRISLNYLLEIGFECEARDGDPFTYLMKKTEDEKINKALSVLLPQQRKLIEKVFFQDMKPLDIATEENVSKQAINNRLNKIYEKLKNFLI